MDEFKCKIADLSRDYKTGKARLTIITDCDIFKSAEELFDKDLNCRLVKFRKKRSLDANAYCWALIGKIADVLRTPKEVVYLDMLRNYGQSEIISVLSDIDVSGYFKYCDEIGTGYVGDREFTHYRIYKGSSEYSTREMSILIDGVISEAEHMGISTITPAQAAELLFFTQTPM